MKDRLHSDGSGRGSGWKRWFSGAGFGVFLLSAALGYELFLVAILFLPAADGFWGDFVTEFKIWCFRYDPRTGGMEWAAVWVMLLEPLFIAGLAMTLWWRGLWAMFSPAGWATLWRPALAGLAFASLASAGLFAYGRPTAADAALPPFPADRLRLGLTPPGFRLADQKGKDFALEDLRGRVVLVTGVYAVCSTSCPEILMEIYDLLETLPAADRKRLSVLALSLNPEYETTEIMDGVATAYGFTYPEFRYLNGEPAFMRDLLTRWQFARVRNPVTGVIEHANLFHLVDTEGKIAYRLALDSRNNAWLREAVLALTSEAAGAPDFE